MSFGGNYNISFFGRLKCVVLRRLKCAIFRRLKCVIFGRLKYLIFVILKYCNFWEIETCRALFYFLKMFYFREIELCHSRGLKYVIFEILQCLNFREIGICPFGRLSSQLSRDYYYFFFGGLSMTFSWNWNVTFSGNEKIELSSFLKTESFIFFGRNHAHKKNCKSKPKTKRESKHTWGTTNVDRICHEIQPPSWLFNKQFAKVKSRNFAIWFEKYFPLDKNFDSVTVS